MTARTERRSFWTWGYVSDEPTIETRKEAAQRLSQRFGREVAVPRIASIDDVELTASSMTITTLRSTTSTNPTESWSDEFSSGGSLWRLTSP